MVDNILIFSIIIVAFVILALLILLIFITIYLTKRLSELSKAITELISTITKKSDELLDQATKTLKTAENSLTDEKDMKTQRLIKNIFRSIAFALEIVSMFKKTKKEGKKDGEGRK